MQPAAKDTIPILRLQAGCGPSEFGTIYRLLHDGVLHICTGAYSVRSTLLRAYRAADALVRSSNHWAACKHRCSYCCKDSMPVFAEEATLIRHLYGVSKPAVASTGGICPFLHKGECAIYPLRPLSCRLLINVGPHPDPCRLEASHIPFLDTSSIWGIVAASLPSQTVLPMKAAFPRKNAERA